MVSNCTELVLQCIDADVWEILQAEQESSADNLPALKIHSRRECDIRTN